MGLCPGRFSFCTVRFCLKSLNRYTVRYTITRRISASYQKDKINRKSLNHVIIKSLKLKRNRIIYHYLICTVKMFFKLGGISVVKIIHRCGFSIFTNIIYYYYLLKYYQFVLKIFHGFYIYNFFSKLKSFFSKFK